MTDSCRDTARRFLSGGSDTTLRLWECFVEQCPHLDLVADALDQLAGFHDFHRQPRKAAAYRMEAKALRKHIEEDEAARQTTIGAIEHSGKFAGRLP